MENTIVLWISQFVCYDRKFEKMYNVEKPKKHP